MSVITLLFFCCSGSASTSGSVFIISQPAQCAVIVLILLVSVLTNCSIIINIINSDIKKSIVTFIIIKNLCIVDLCGACLILPAPLLATIKGREISLQLPAALILGHQAQVSGYSSPNIPTFLRVIK